MKKLLLIILPVLLVITSSLIGDSSDFYLDCKYIGESFTDTREVLLAPLSWETNDLLTGGICTGAGLALYLTDKRTHSFVQNHTSTMLDNVTDAVNYLGDGWVVITSQLLLYGYGYVTDDLTARKIALETMESFVIVGATVTALKMLTGRHRPNDTKNPDIWDGPSLSYDNTSFPSGHTAVAFSWATVLAENFKDQPTVGIIAYTLAAGTGFARVYKNKHWVSDIVIGAVIGHFMTKKIVSLHEDEKVTKISFFPTPIGFSISFSF